MARGVLRQRFESTVQAAAASRSALGRLLLAAACLVAGMAPAAASADRFLSVGWERGVAPVLRPAAGGAWDDRAVYVPRLTKRLDGSAYRDALGRYFLYYTASGFAAPNFDATGLAVSTDLVTWTRLVPERPVLPRGPAGAPDHGDASIVTALHDGERFHAWYEGNGRIVGSDLVTINYATSRDGVHWDKHGPVVTPGQDGDAEDLYAPVVVKSSGLWRMWYAGHDRSGRNGLMHATAPAPEGPWSKAADSYLFYPRDLFPTDAWIERGVYHLLYFESTARRQEIKLATSIDGRAWTSRGAVFVGGNAGAWDSARVTWAMQVRIEQAWVMLYDGHNGRQPIAVGVARGPARADLIRGGLGVPGPPVNVTATAEGSRVTLSWSLPLSGDAAQRYVIDAGSSFGTARLGTFELTTTSATFDPVATGSYFIRVRAANAAGISDASNEAELVVGVCDAAPGAPGNLRASITPHVDGGQVTLQWEPSGGCPAAGYIVEAGTHPGGSNAGRVDLVAGVSQISIVAPRGTYYVRVRARGLDGRAGPASSELEIRID